MGKDTLRRNIEDRPPGWLSKNLFQLIIGALVSLLAFLSSWVFTEITKLRSSISKLDATVDSFRKREVETMWKTLGTFKDDIEDNRVGVEVLNRLYGVHSAENRDWPDGEPGISHEEIMEMILDVMRSRDDNESFRIRQAVEQKSMENIPFDPKRIK